MLSDGDGERVLESEDRGLRDAARDKPRAILCTKQMLYHYRWIISNLVPH